MEDHVHAVFEARYNLPVTSAAGATMIDVPVSAELDFSMSSSETHEIFAKGRRAAARQLALMHASV